MKIEYNNTRGVELQTLEPGTMFARPGNPNYIMMVLDREDQHLCDVPEPNWVPYTPLCGSGRVHVDEWDCLVIPVSIDSIRVQQGLL